MAQTDPNTDPDQGGATLDDLIGYNVKRVSMLLQADFRETMGRDGLSPGVFAALSLVVAAPGITQSDLARRLGIERSGLVAIVDDLERRGYLRRAAVPGDRRVQALRPTEDGRATHEAAFARIRQGEARLLNTLSERERALLLQLLGKIRAAAGEFD